MIIVRKLCTFDLANDSNTTDIHIAEEHSSLLEDNWSKTQAHIKIDDHWLESRVCCPFQSGDSVVVDSLFIVVPCLCGVCCI